MNTASPPTPTIYLNNSSLPELACGTRYNYRILKGAIIPKSPELSTGLAFHDMMRTVEKDTHPLEIVQKPPASAGSISQLTLLNLANLAVQTAGQIDLSGERELFLEYSASAEVRARYPDLADKSFNARFCGTLDLISYDEAEDCIVITDYKTTQKKIDGKFFLDYALKSQRPFYINLLSLTYYKLPKKYQAAAVNGRIKFRYIFVNYVDKTVHVQPAQYMHTDTLAQTLNVMYEKLALAVYYHLNPSASYKDGMFFGHCFFCPFKQLCSTFDPIKEQEMIEKWPYGFRIYDPQHREIA